MSKALFVLLALALLIGCEKHQDAQAARKDNGLNTLPRQDFAVPEHATPFAQNNRGKQDVAVNIPAKIKGKWQRVVVTLTDKESKSETDYTVAVGGRAALTGTNRVIEIKAFVPHFVMDAKGITSESIELKNPAAKAVITENGKVIYTGWLFKKHPSVPLFMHKEIDVQLKDAVAAP